MATPQGDGSIVLTTKVATAGIQKGMTVIKNSIKMATVALTAFGTAIGYLVKESVQAYAEYEQLVGGVETLFKDSADKVMKFANEAYKSAGLSANAYMENVTAFSASLLNSLGGDTDKAAEVANEALISISDNANKMGSSLESVTMAFQGFAKGQYQLLDNLKLGYGGTKTEMERLLKDAEAYRASMGETVEYEINNLADVYTAIGDIQRKLGIAGTTAKEAATTISGSAGMMKASWQNVLVAISGGGDIDAAIENLVDSVEIYFKNIAPVVERALIGIGTVIERIAPMLIQTVASAFIKALPQLISAVWQMIQGLFQGVKLALIELLSGKPNEIIEEQAEKTAEVAKNQEELTENIKDTNKELKKTLAGFDDIQILSAGVAEEEQINPFQNQSVETEENKTSDGSPIVQEVNETFVEIAGKVSGWLMALGCILLVTGNIGWGIGLIIAGAIGSEYAEAQVGDGSSLKELIDTITNVLIIAGVVAIILGILLCVAQMWGLGIKLIAIGAISVGGSVALNWDGIKEQLQTSFGGWLAVGGVIAIVLGILLCFTPLLPLGLGLIALGAGSIVAPIVANWDAIVNVLKKVWEGVKVFWNTHIAPVFTAKWWLDLGKTCINGLIAGFEGGINGIIGAFEKMINWIVDGLNKISFDIPDWLGGGSFGINLPRANFGRVSIPRLAQGAVIPPNKEFLAVLGDQKQGTNIEAPLQTIVDAFNIATRQNGDNTSSKEIVLVLDGRELGRAIVELGDEESQRIGTRLVIA